MESFFLGANIFLDLVSDSDEWNCTKTCSANELLCSNSVCLPISKFCNGVPDCSNDEIDCEHQEPCEQKNCDYDCRITPVGAKCRCPEGQQLVNSTKCEDVNECEFENEVCDQICENLVNTYSCSCNKGFEKKNNRCRALFGELVAKIPIHTQYIINYLLGNETSIFILTSNSLRLLPLGVFAKEFDPIETPETAWEKPVLNFTKPIYMEIVNHHVCVLDELLITCYDLFKTREDFRLSGVNSLLNFQCE